VKIGGDDVPKFEPVKRLNIRNLDPIIRQLRKLYNQNQEWFNIPVFAQKIY
jgi:hypothetical protein